MRNMEARPLLVRESNAFGQRPYAFARQSALMEPRFPLGCGTAREDLRKRRRHRIGLPPKIFPLVERRKTAVDRRLRAERRPEPLVLFGREDPQHQATFGGIVVAQSGFVHFGYGRARTDCFWRHHQQCGLQHRYFDPAAQPIRLPRVERRGNRKGRVPAGGIVDHAEPGFLPPALIDHARSGLHDIVISVRRSPRSRRAKTADMAIYQIGLVSHQRVGTDANRVERTSNEVLDKDVGAGDKAEENFSPLRLLQIQRDRALVRALHLIGKSKPRRSKHAISATRPRGIGPLRRFDLDDVGSKQRELIARERPRQHLRQIDHSRAGKGLVRQCQLLAIRQHAVYEQHTRIKAGFVSSIFHRDLTQVMAVASSGEGVFIVDDAGKRYLDACGGAAVSCLGHDPRDVVEAVSRQLETLAFAHTGFFTNDPAECLAARLVELAPAGFGAGRAMFLGSGSEAIEAALKLARQYHLERGDPDRTQFIARDGAYHGNTLGALAAGGHVERRRPYEPMLSTFGRASACYAYRLQHPGESDDAFGLRQAQTLEAEILCIGPQRVACFILEPVSGATLGCVPPVGQYLSHVREICDRYGVLVIADEVMCGAGRTGPYFASAIGDLRPDIIALAKGLGAGFMPIAATLASEKVVTAVAAGSGRLWNGHTYMSHAVACAGALAVLDIVERDDLLERVATLGEGLRARLVARFGDHPFVGDIRGSGLFLALELVADRSTKRPFDPSVAFAAMLKRAAMAEGLLVYPAAGCVDGIRGDHVVIAPPYVVDELQLDMIVDRLARAIDVTLGDRRAAA